MTRNVLTHALAGSFLLGLTLACSKPPNHVYSARVDGSKGDATESGDSSPELPKGADKGEIEGETKNLEPSASGETQGPAVPPTPGPISDPTSPPMPATPLPLPTAPAALVECSKVPSVGRIYQWLATTEGTMIPSSGSIVVKEGDKNVARVKFVGEGWHVLPTWLKNAYETEVDLSASKNFTLTYSATSDLYAQLRPSFAWSGGDKYLVKIPSTAGQVKSLTISFEAASWTTLPSLGVPSYPFAMALKQARGLVFVGQTPNEIVFSGLTIDAFEPPCP